VPAMPRDLAQVYQRVSAVEQGQLGCQVWLGSLSQDGRASTWDPDLRRPVSVLRLLWEHQWGPIPDGLMLCHQCHHRWCVNLGHVAIGPPSANAVGTAAMHRSAIGRGTGGGRGGLSRLPERERNHLALRQAQAVRDKHRQYGQQYPLFQ